MLRAGMSAAESRRLCGYVPLIAACAALAWSHVVPPAASAAPTRKFMKSLAAAAGCVVRGNRTAASGLAAAEPASAGETAALAAVAPQLGFCLDRAKLEDTPDTRSLVVGEVAAWLYLERVGGRLTIWQVSEAELDATLKQAIMRKTENWPAPAAAAECYSSIAGGLTDRLLRTRKGSAAEAAAMRRIVAYLPRCLPAGRQLQVSPERLRAELARAAYRQLLPLPSPRR